MINRKRICIFLVVLIVFSLAACSSAEEPSAPSASDAATEETAVLSIRGLNYAKSGTTGDFRISGVINGPAALECIECSGSLFFDPLGTDIGVDNTTPFYFEEDVTSADMAMLQDYLSSQLSAVYEAASMLMNIDDCVNVTLDCTCYDTLGNTVNFTVIYEIIAE